jgi:hypothetical protein
MKLRESFEFLTEHENGIIKNTPMSMRILLRYEPSKIRITVAPNREKRSLNQNAYYWGVIIPAFCEKTGHSPKRMDRVFENEYCPREIILHRGKEHAVPKHCKDLSPGEFANFLTQLIAEAGELGISIPPPSFDHQTI